MPKLEEMTREQLTGVVRFLQAQNEILMADPMTTVVPTVPVSVTDDEYRGILLHLQDQLTLLRQEDTTPEVHFNWVTLDDAVPGNQAVDEAAMLQFPRYVLQEMASWAASLLEGKKAGQFMELRYPGGQGVPPMYVTFVRDDGPSMADTIHELRKELTALKASRAD